MTKTQLINWIIHEVTLGLTLRNASRMIAHAGIQMNGNISDRLYAASANRTQKTINHTQCREG
jgi:hypothetical protein